MTIAEHVSAHEMPYLEAQAADIKSFPLRNAKGIAAYKSANEDCTEFCANFNKYAEKHPNYAYEASHAAARVLHNVQDLNEGEQRGLIKAVVNAMSYSMMPVDEPADKEERAVSCARVFNFIYDKHRDMVPMMKEQLGELCAEIKNDDPIAAFRSVRACGSEGVVLKHPMF